MQKTLKFALLGFALSSGIATAQTPAKPTLDSNLVGTWEGEFPPVKEESCTAYKWRMERHPDGTYHFQAYDATQTILNDEGRWWVDPANSKYFETVTGQSDEPTVYTYAISENNINAASIHAEYNLVKEQNASECSQTFNFSETKTS